MIPKLMAGIALAVLTLSACSGGSNAKQGGTTAPAVAKQTNPPGDIPDTQAFVSYASSRGYSVLVPEGWSRTRHDSAVRFTWSYDGEQVSLLTGSAEAHIRQTFSAVAHLKTNRVTVARHPALLYTFTSRSQRNAVTWRSIMLENNSYVYAKGSRRIILDLWAPQGADNVDQWRKISGSLRWKT